MTLYTAAYHSPVGPIAIESDGEALTGLRFGEEKTPATLPVFDEVIRWLDDYFAGRQTENAIMGAKKDARIAAKPRGTMFQQRVWQALVTIPYGKTVSYGEIARMVGCKSAQAVGQAVGANPIALLIPCHRVIAVHGKLGGYAYGIELKRHLLEWEKSPTETFAMRTRCERE